MKKAISLILTLALILCMIPSAFAASSEATEAANTLNALGLFNGTGIDADGKAIYNLDRAPTRAEAVAMLVRLLGKEAEAKAETWITPFTDVADWAKPYIGYAYTNKLTSGTGATTFGGTSIMTAAQYCTLLLRALGYQSGTDFQWDNPWELSSRLEIAYDYQYQNNFTRGDVAVLSQKALTAFHKDTGVTLLYSLIEAGSVSTSSLEDKKSFSYPFVSYVKYNGKTYSSEHIGSFSTEVDNNTLEIYTNFPMALFPIETFKNTDNPYIDGSLEFLTSSVVTEQSGYQTIGINTVFEPTFTCTMNGKTFLPITAQEYLNGTYANGDVGVWNGVKYVLNIVPTGGPTRVEFHYNLNDLAAYFGLNRDIHLEYDGEVYYLVITDK